MFPNLSSIFGSIFSNAPGRALVIMVSNISQGSNSAVCQKNGGLMERTGIRVNALSTNCRKSGESTRESLGDQACSSPCCAEPARVGRGAL